MARYLPWRFGAKTRGDCSGAPLLHSKPGWRHNMDQIDRITMHPDQMGGRPCVRGLRVTVGMIVGQIGAGRAVSELLDDYPYLDHEDILQALRYAAWRAEEREVRLAS